MRWLTCALLLGIGSTLFAPAAYGQTGGTLVSITAEGPKFPTPLQAAVLGLSLTAVAVIGARVSHRSSDLMMYMVLASLALTAVMVAYADRVHSQFIQAGFERLAELERQVAATAKS